MDRRRHDLANTLAALGARAALRRRRPSTRPAASAPAGSRSEPLVLVVEDEPSLRELVRAGLEDRGWTTVTVAHAEDALGVAAAYGHVDVVVTDVVMPRMSGCTLVDRLRRMLPRLRVVYLSGVDPRELELDRTTAHVGKPFELDELDRTIRVLLAEA